MVMSTKIARGSTIILLGSFIFRIGGYIYRFSMAYLLGPAGYGILGLTLPLMGILQLSAEGGIPPAVAKYIAEYNAKNQQDMISQVIKTSSKLILIMGFVFSLVIFVLAEPLAVNVFHKPEAIVPFQMIALITPFSVITGELKGIFQGFYQMVNIVITKAFEQSFMIIFAVILVLANYYVAGAVIGTAIGYMAAGVAGFILFRKFLWSKIFSSPQESANEKISFRDELGLAKMLLVFSIPVVITSLAELALYDMGTFVIGAYLPSEYVGYYNAASPIARLPLIISMAVATAVLPATSEAFSVNDHVLLKTYVRQAFRYVTLIVLPLSVGTIVFSTPIINLLFPGYTFGSDALKILAAGMLFFTIYTVSASISQGMGKPYIPMYALLGGTLFELVASIILVPYYGINGAAIATTLAALIIMSTVAWKTLKLAQIKLPIGDYGRIVIAALVMGFLLMFYPKNFIFFLLALVTAPIIYLSTLIPIGGLKKSDVNALKKLARRLGPLSGFLTKLAVFLERFAT
jgi:stage V sporulation protein B